MLIVQNNQKYNFILKATLAVEMALQVWTFLYEQNFVLNRLCALAHDMNRGHRQTPAHIFVRVWF